MCEIATLSLIGSLASTVMGGVAQYQQQQAQAQAAQQAANYNAQIAAHEAETQAGLARAEMEKGAAERGRVLRAGLAKQGEAAAGLGASGFALDQGASLSLLAQKAEETQHEASLAGQNAALKAWSHMAKATRAGNEGAFNRYLATRPAPPGLAGTLLGGLGKGLSGFYRNT